MPGEALRRGQPVRRAAAAAVLCRRGARRAIHTPGKACRRHRATRGAGTNAAVACHGRRTVCLLFSKQLVCRQAPVSQQARNIIFRVSRGYCQLVENFKFIS